MHSRQSLFHVSGRLLAVILAVGLLMATVVPMITRAEGEPNTITVVPPAGSPTGGSGDDTLHTLSQPQTDPETSIGVLDVIEMVIETIIL